MVGRRCPQLAVDPKPLSPITCAASGDLARIPPAFGKTLNLHTSSLTLNLTLKPLVPGFSISIAIPTFLHTPHFTLPTRRSRKALTPKARRAAPLSCKAALPYHLPPITYHLTPIPYPPITYHLPQLPLVFHATACDRVTPLYILYEFRIAS